MFPRPHSVLQDAGTWQTALRALCAIEAVVDSGSSAACGQVAVHFQAHPEAVRRAADSPQASVRQRAQKLLVLLGAAAPPAAGGGSSSGTSASQQPLVTEDLLGGADGAAPSSSPAAALEDLLGNGSSSAAGDLLSGLGGPPAAGAAPSSLQLVAEPAPAGTGSAVADDLFSGMLLEGQPASALPPPASPLDLLASLGGPPSAPASAPAPAPAGGLGDLLGELSLGPSPAPGGPGGQPLQQPLGGMGLQLGAAPLTSPQPVGTGMGHALPQAPALGSGGLPQALLGSGPVQHGRQPSLGMLGSGEWVGGRFGK